MSTLACYSLALNPIASVGFAFLVLIWQCSYSPPEIAAWLQSGAKRPFLAEEATDIWGFGMCVLRMFLPSNASIFGRISGEADQIAEMVKEAPTIKRAILKVTDVNAKRLLQYTLSVRKKRQELFMHRLCKQQVSDFLELLLVSTHCPEFILFTSLLN